MLVWDAYVVAPNTTDACSGILGLGLRTVQLLELEYGFLETRKLSISRLSCAISTWGEEMVSSLPILMANNSFVS